MGAHFISSRIIQEVYSSNHFLQGKIQARIPSQLRIDSHTRLTTRPPHHSFRPLLAHLHRSAMLNEAITANQRAYTPYQILPCEICFKYLAIHLVHVTTKENHPHICKTLLEERTTPGRWPAATLAFLHSSNITDAQCDIVSKMTNNSPNISQT